MPSDVQITWRSLSATQWIDDLLREQAAKLDRYHDHIVRCHVVLEAPYRKGRKGNHFHLRISVHVPGREIMVTRDPPPKDDAEDIRAVIRDAFSAAQRQLQEQARIERRNVKRHEDNAVVGRVIAPLELDHGFIEAPTGEEVYFHKNALGDGWDAVEVGSIVRFIQGEGDKGPQAVVVHLVEATPPA